MFAWLVFRFRWSILYERRRIDSIPLKLTTLGQPAVELIQTGLRSIQIARQNMVSGLVVNCFDHIRRNGRFDAGWAWVPFGMRTVVKFCCTLRYSFAAQPLQLSAIERVNTFLKRSDPSPARFDELMLIVVVQRPLHGMLEVVDCTQCVA